MAMSPTNLLFAFVGCLLGTVVGVLPGLGPAAAMAILIPITFNLEPTPAIIMISALYYGTQYGGTITSVLVNVPGESTSVVTCLDGFQMAKQGRGGTALGIASIGSFVGGTFGTLALMVMALPLASFALRFGPPEMFSLLLAGLTLVTALGGSSLPAALLMTVFGLALSMIGIDPLHGLPRFTFGIPELYDGVGLVPMVMGLFGVGELLASLENPNQQVVKTSLSNLFPSREEWGRASRAIGRGTVVGFFLGLIPGIAGIIPTFVAYVLEKRVSKHPERFGTGVIEGVASPESANNAYAQASMVPLFTLGIPGTASLAVLMGAFMINGITPGPFLFKEHADVVWGVIASFYVGNVMLLILNLPLVSLWAKLLEIRYEYLYPGILVFCVIGAYSLKQSVFDVGLMLSFGLMGYVCRKLRWPLAPAVLALILGPMLEKSLRSALDLSGGDFSVFFTSPISATLLAVAAIILVSSFARKARSRGRLLGGVAEAEVSR